MPLFSRRPNPPAVPAVPAVDGDWAAAAAAPALPFVNSFDAAADDDECWFRLPFDAALPLFE